MKSHIVLCLSLLFFSFFIFSSKAAAEEYISSGKGPTEQAAIQDSFRQALESAEGIRIESDTYTINDIVAQDRIHAYRKGFIRNYVLLESHWNGSFYTVRTKVTILPAPSENDYASSTAAHSGSSTLRLAVCINDKAGKISAASSIAAAATETIADALFSAGFPHILNLPQMTGRRIHPFRKNTVPDNPPAASVLGQSLQLDYMITGDITSQNIPVNLQENIPFFSSCIILNINLVKCDTGETVWSEQYQETGLELSRLMAEREAACKNGKKAGIDIVAKLRSTAICQTKTYTLYLHKLKTFQQVSSLENYLNYACGVQNIAIKSFADGDAVLTMDFKGENDGLAGFLMQNLDASATITKMTSNTIDLTYQENQKTISERG